ncbi:MAG: hypothetical protein HY874_06830 [Chloroflexi bacterium]|nr:hypothetical protein [Chloroflexota bacterium]
MNLKKNFVAKIAACIASIGALAAVWGIVHQNPPPPAAGAQTETSPAAAATATTQRRTAAPATVPLTTRRHARTHVS